MARPYVITIASEKGGVGKTTLATNLAIYLKGLAEDTPVTLFSLDNHFTVDQMFQLSKSVDLNHVGQIFTGTSMERLVVTGQYGVDYIPSNSHLFEDLKYVKSVDQLAQAITRSQLQGILIIDTSPILDKYTRNAIHAADRVIVPIKDAPSLENSRHISDFVTQYQRPKSVLKILPCLIDTRIHFDGPFRNSYQLLKGYAINRGYRCYEGFIAKSPKVETLGTNPSGKVYPVITHARNTDVHLQLTHLARQVYLDYLEHGPSRLTELDNELFEFNEHLHHQYRERLNKLQSTCLCCSQELNRDNVWPNSYYLESEDGRFCGFVEDECFFQLLLQDCYPELSGKEQQNLLRDLLNNPSLDEYLLFHKTQNNAEKAQIAVVRLDQNGNKLAERIIEPKESGIFQRRGATGLLQLFKTMTDDRGETQQTLLAKRVDETPLNILTHQPYLELKTVFNRALIDLQNTNVGQ